MAGRGALTPEVQAKAKELLGYEIDRDELRMFPYIQYVMVNEQRIDPAKCNQSDRDILSKWREKKFIEGGASGLAITKEFWDIICEMVFISYVDIGE